MAFSQIEWYTDRKYSTQVEFIVQQHTVYTLPNDNDDFNDNNEIKEAPQMKRHFAKTRQRAHTQKFLGGRKEAHACK